MTRWFDLFVVAIAFIRGDFAAGLVATQDGITLGEVQPGEAIEKTIVISNDAEWTIAVTRVKTCGRNEKRKVKNEKLRW